MGGIWWRGDLVFGVLRRVIGGRGILHGAQETGGAGSGRRDLAGSGGSIGGVNAVSGAVYQRWTDMKR